MKILLTLFLFLFALSAQAQVPSAINLIKALSCNSKHCVDSVIGAYIGPYPQPNPYEAYEMKGYYIRLGKEKDICISTFMEVEKRDSLLHSFIALGFAPDPTRQYYKYYLSNQYTNVQLQILDEPNEITQGEGHVITLGYTYRLFLSLTEPKK